MHMETSGPDQAVRLARSQWLPGIYVGILLLAGCGTDLRPVPTTAPREPRADTTEFEAVVDELLGLMRSSRPTSSAGERKARGNLLTRATWQPT
ncbi:MAG TPA: hypothetical protein VMV69_20410 [Pirellulales bacterium]|nr:hypothetical protein [Pirellulales bacterium]